MKLGLLGAQISAFKHVTNKFNKSFCFKLIIHWQSLSGKFKEQVNIQGFTKSLKKHLIEQY